MTDVTRLDPVNGFATLEERLRSTPPGSLLLIGGPRQVGKTHLLLQLAQARGSSASYAACDGPEAALGGWWEAHWADAEQRARSGEHLLLLDEVHRIPDWRVRLKEQSDQALQRKLLLQVVATGSLALHLGGDTGARKTAATVRIERMVFPHWSAASLSAVFGIPLDAAVEHLLTWGGYPAVMSSDPDPIRRRDQVRDGIIEPAIGRDLLSAHDIRKPGLLRQVFAAAVAAPAQVVSLQKLQTRLPDRAALETIVHHLTLLEDAFLIASLQKYSTRTTRQRAAPSKLVVLSNALLAAFGGPSGTPAEGVSLAHRIENACLAHAWSSGQQVRYWREEPLEVDAILDGSWGSWAVEIKTGRTTLRDLAGLLAFVRRYPRYRPLLICREEDRGLAERGIVRAVTWNEFLTDQWLPRSAPPTG